MSSIAPVNTSMSTPFEKDQIESIVNEAIMQIESKKSKNPPYFLIFGSLLTLMSIAVVGTTYATVKLTKDMQVDHGSLVGIDGKVIATQTVGVTINGDLQYELYLFIP